MSLLSFDPSTYFYLGGLNLQIVTKKIVEDLKTVQTQVII